MVQGLNNPDGTYLRPIDVVTQGFPEDSDLPFFRNDVQNSAYWNTYISALNALRLCGEIRLLVEAGDWDGNYPNPKPLASIGFPTSPLPYWANNIQQASRHNFIIDAINALRRCYITGSPTAAGRTNIDGTYLQPEAIADLNFPTDPIPTDYFGAYVQHATRWNYIIDALNSLRSCCLGVCESGAAPAARYEELLTDITDLAGFMAKSYEMDDSTPYPFAGQGTAVPTEIGGKALVNVAGLSVVSDATSLNGTRHLRLLTGPNVGEAGYGYQNITHLFPAHVHMEFCAWCALRKMEGGPCHEGDFVIQTPNFFEGMAFWRNPATGFVMPESYMIELTGDFISPISGATHATADIITVWSHWILSNKVQTRIGTNPLRADFGLYTAERYDVSLEMWVLINGVESPGRRTVTGRVESSYYRTGLTSATSIPVEPAPWQMAIPGQVFSDGNVEVHGFGWKVA